MAAPKDVPADLKQLLSPFASLSGSLDEFTPLSTPDLHILLEQMQLRSEEIKDRVYTTVKMHYKQFVDMVSEADRVALDVASLQIELQKVLAAIGRSYKQDFTDDEEIGFCFKIRKLACEAQGLRRQIEERQECLVVVEHIVLVYDRIVDAERVFWKGKFVEGAAQLRDIGECLRMVGSQVQDDKFETVKPYTLLSGAWSSTFTKLEDILGRLLSRAIVINAKDSKLQAMGSVDLGEFLPPFNSTGVQISTILEALNILGSLDAKISGIADLLYKVVIDPILQGSLTIISTTKSCKNEDPQETCLNWAMNNHNTEQTLGEMYMKILQTIQFLNHNVFQDDKTWMRHFGRTIWPRVTDAIITKYLKKVISTENPQVLEVEKSTLEFEEALEKENLISRHDFGGDKLSCFVSDMEAHFASKKKKQVLAKARHMIRKFDYDIFLKDILSGGSINADTELLFKSEGCIVSPLAKQLVLIIHESLEAASSSTQRTALELYQAARDVAFLFLAIVPNKLERQVDCMRRAAAICHNDCLYIAHELLALKFEFDPILPSELKYTCTFVDIVPLLRRMSEEFLMKEVELIESRLRRVLDGANGFGGTDNKRHYDAADQSLKQAAVVLQNAWKIWHSLLPNGVFIKVFGLLLDSTMARLSDEVLSLDDISVEETVQLRKLIIGFMEPLVGLIAPAFSHEKGSLWIELGNAVPSWWKLSRLADMLDMSLVAITKSWENGDLSSCGFSSSEVQKLIRAIFSDTQLRMECLHRITVRTPT